MMGLDMDKVQIFWARSRSRVQMSWRQVSSGGKRVTIQLLSGILYPHHPSMKGHLWVPC